LGQKHVESESEQKGETRCVYRVVGVVRVLKILNILTHCNLITIYIKYVVGVLELEDVKTYLSLQLDYNLH
jgi:hypothetical protein